MKKLYFLLLAAILGTGFSFSAKALDFTIKWEIPGSIVLRMGSSSAEPVAIPDDATEYIIKDYDKLSGGERYLNIQGKGEYLITGAHSISGTPAFKPAAYGDAPFVSVSMYSSELEQFAPDYTLIVDCIKPVRDKTFTIDVEGDASMISCKFSSTGYTIPLKNGENTIAFNPELDYNLTIETNNKIALKSLSINGENVPLPYMWSTGWNRITVAPGDKLVVVTPEVPKYAVTFEGETGAIESLYYTDFIYAPFTGIEIPQGGILRVNINSDDYTLNSILVNGTNYTAQANTNGTFTFPVNGPTTVKIDAKEREYEDIYFTIIAENMEGINLRGAKLMSDEGEALTPGAGAAVTATIPSLAYGYKFDMAATKQYTVAVSEKYAKIWASPKAGWYIQTLQQKEEGDMITVGVISDPTASYIIAKKYENDGEITVNVIGNMTSTLDSRNPDFGMWQNPNPNFRLATGTQTIEFVKGMTLFNGVPAFTAYISGATENNKVYLNGEECEQAVTDDGDAILGKYYFNYAASTPAPIITYYAATEAPKFATLTIKGDDAAELLSTPLAYSAQGPWKFFTNYPVLVRLSNPAFEATLNGTKVTANSEGILEIALTEGDNTLELAAPAIEYADYQAIEPAAGATVKALGEFKLIIPFDENTLFQPMIDWDLTSAITLTNGTTTITGAEPGEPEPITDSSWATVAIAMPFTLSEAATEAGEWTLTIPEGLIYTGTYDEATEAFIHNGVTFSGLTATYTLDANACPYTLNPAAGSNITSLTTFTITFDGYTTAAWDEETEITLSDGTENYTAMEVKIPEDSNTATLFFNASSSEPGQWTLTIPEGAFILDAKAYSEAVSATYDYAPNWKLTPAPGSTIENGNEFTLEFPFAEKAEFIGESYAIHLGNAMYVTPGYNVTAVAGAEHPTFKLTLKPGAARVPMGLLTLGIDEESFLIDGEPNAYITAEYNVQYEVGADYQVTPEGTLVPDDWGWLYPTFIFEEGASVRFVGSYYNTVTVTLDGKPLKAGEQFQASIEGIYLMFMIAMPEEGGSELEISIAEGGLTIGGKPSPAISHSWAVATPKDYTYTISVDPDETTGDLSSITVYFPEAQTIALGDYPNASLRDSKFNYFVNGSFELIQGERTGVKITFNPAPADDGIYTFDLRGGSFILDGANNSPEINAVYNFDKSTAIDAISVEADDAVYYNLQGIRVHNPAKGATYIKRQGNTVTKIAL